MASSNAPELLSTIEGSTDTVNAVSGISGDDSVISASDDKLVSQYFKSTKVSAVCMCSFFSSFVVFFF